MRQAKNIRYYCTTLNIIMDNNFSAQVKEIISFSREEALRLGNDFIGTEHLLLGLIREGENTAIKCSNN
jgi:ATP-dependent Clp protease ATP-binding subunit ClpA